MVSRALAEQSLGRWVDAAEHLATVSPETRDAWVTHNRAAIESARGVIADHVGWLDLTITPLDARVFIAGRSAGNARRVRVARGDVTVRVESAGHVPEEHVVRVDGSEGSRLEVSLAREATRAPEPLALHEARPEGMGTAQGGLGPRHPYRGWMWVSVAVSGLALSGAGVAWWAREVSLARYNDPGCVTVFASRDERCSAYREAAAANEAVAIAGAVVGGVAGVAGLVLGVLDAGAARRERVWACGATGWGGACVVRF